MNGHVEIKRDGSWSLIGEDSRLRREREAKQIQGRLGRWMDPVFCMNCGTPQGFAMRTSWAIYVQCDNCFEKFGEPGGYLARLPEEEETYWWNKRLGYRE